MSTAPKMGTIGWAALTVPDAEGVRDFYRTVATWHPLYPLHGLLGQGGA